MPGPDSTTPLVCSATLQILPLRFEPLGFFFFFPLLLTVFIYVPLKKLCFGRIDRVYDSDDFLSSSLKTVSHTTDSY